MEALDSLLSRRSPALTTITEPGPSADQIRIMLTAAARVPDHGKLVPWRFVLVQGEARSRLAEHVATAWLDDHAGDPVEARQAGVQQWAARFTAPLVVVVVSRPVPNPKVPAWEQELSAGACCMNLLHAAKALGFGAVWLSEWYAYDRRITARLGIGQGERIAGLIHIGTVREPRADRQRPDLNEIVSVASL